MTSEEIKTQQGVAVSEAEKLIGKNDTTYVAQMHNVYLLEIAYQLARLNEFERQFRCIRCYRRIEHYSQKCDRAAAGPCLGMS